MSALRVRALGVAYGARRALAGVTLDVEGGEWLGLIGPNGAGKSTLLRAVAGLVHHDGAVELDGRPASELGRRGRARRVALVDQDPPLPPGMRVDDYVLLGRTPYISHFGREGPADRRAVAEVLTALDLRSFAGRRLGELSGGERQRAVVARALAQEPVLLLLDEPTSALDLGRQQLVLELVAERRARAGLTVVSATHDLTLAAAYADRLALLADGRVVAEGTPAAVLTEARLTHHYRARVRVLGDAEGGIAVIPVRG